MMVLSGNAAGPVYSPETDKEELRFSFVWVRVVCELYYLSRCRIVIICSY